MPWAGNIVKTMTSNGKQFTVTREMLTAVACDQRWPDVVTGISVCFSKFVFVLFYYITNHLMTGPLGKSEFCFPRIPLFPLGTSHYVLIILWPALRVAISTKPYTMIGYPSRQAEATSYPPRTVYHIMQKKLFLCCMINPLLTNPVQSRWLDTGVTHFYVLNWTFKVHKLNKLTGKNLANIQRSWPHARSIIHSHGPCTNFSFNEYKQKYAQVFQSIKQKAFTFLIPSSISLSVASWRSRRRNRLFSILSSLAMLASNILSWLIRFTWSSRAISFLLLSARSFCCWAWLRFIRLTEA